MVHQLRKSYSLTDLGHDENEYGGATITEQRAITSDPGMQICQSRAWLLSMGAVEPADFGCIIFTGKTFTHENHHFYFYENCKI